MSKLAEIAFNASWGDDDEHIHWTQAGKAITEPWELAVKAVRAAIAAKEKKAGRESVTWHLAVLRLPKPHARLLMCWELDNAAFEDRVFEGFWNGKVWRMPDEDVDVEIQSPLYWCYLPKGPTR